MRRLLTGWMVLAAIAATPVLALAGNQDVANDIAKSLRDSGQLEHYKIGVRYQDGTAWVRGYVSDQKQMAAALNLVAGTQGVERVVNELQIGVVQTKPVAAAPTPSKTPKLAAASLGGPAKDKTRTADLVTTPDPASSLQTKIRLTAQPIESQAKKSAPKPVGSLARVAMQPSAPSPRSVQQPVQVPVQMSVPRQPIPVAYTQPGAMPQQVPGGPMPAYTAAMGGGVAPVQYDQPHMPNHAWPSYAAYPNYAAVTYPRQHSPAAWPYIGPFYPYPQVPLGWRKVTLEWDDGWWMLDFCDSPRRCKW